MTADPDRWSRLKTIFTQALSLSMADRPAYLDDECEKDADLRRDAERLLESHDMLNGFLETPPFRTEPPVDSLAGQTVGPYVVEARIGSGGMGDVYRAIDVRLGRAVALKVVAANLAADPQVAARLEREARAVAALAHPHICALYDIGRHGPLPYLVMEYVEGETMAAQIERGPMPIDRAVAFGIQIASALTHAHKAGIVHRDLKPGNVMVTKSGVKLLDFGIAKAVSAGGDAGARMPATSGIVLGTASYMAPEQIEGRDGDPRIDVFAFGALLYELLTGKRAFDGVTQAAVVAAVLTHETPSAAALQPSIPPALDRIVRTALEKDPDDRWQTARDLCRELEWFANGTQSAARPGRRSRKLFWTVSAGAAVLIAVSTAVALWTGRRSAAPTDVLRPALARFEVQTPETGEPLSIALAPDGRRLAYVGKSDGVERIWVRSLDQISASVLPGTDGATFPFWSPDGSAIAFFADGKLKRVDVAGGTPVPLANAASPRGGTWNRSGEIIFAPTTARALMVVNAAGGDARPVTELASGQTSHRWPQFLPDGRRFLFESALSKERGLFLASLDGGPVRRVLADEVPVLFTAPDRLLVVRGGALAVVRFDPIAGTTGGDPIAVAPVVGLDLIYGRGAVTVSDNGVLAYRRIAAEPRRLAWLDRTGRSLRQVGAVDEEAPGSPEVTPDGRRAAISRVHDGNADVWIVDADSGVRTRFTSEPSTDMFPVWSHDGRSVIFSANRDGDYDLYERSVVGGAERLLVRSSEPKVPDCVTPDGRLLIYSSQAARNGVDLWAVRLQEQNATPFPVLATVFDEMAAQVSPDGRWLAYQSNLSGRMEVYIRPFPGEGTEQQVSPEGGSEPRWSPDGRELYFISGRDTLMAAALRRGADLQVETLRALFPLRLASGVGIYPAVGTRAQYAVSRDGRFLVNVPVNPAPPASIVVTLNYDRALAR